jgi:hypothetical protein
MNLTLETDEPPKTDPGLDGRYGGIKPQTGAAITEHAASSQPKVQLDVRFGARCASCTVQLQR